MLEQDLRETGWSFAFPSVAERGVLGTEAFQAFMWSVK